MNSQRNYSGEEYYCITYANDLRSSDRIILVCFDLSVTMAIDVVLFNSMNSQRIFSEVEYY